MNLHPESRAAHTHTHAISGGSAPSPGRGSGWRSGRRRNWRGKRSSKQQESIRRMDRETTASVEDRRTSAMHVARFYELKGEGEAPLCATWGPCDFLVEDD